MKKEKAARSQRRRRSPFYIAIILIAYVSLLLYAPITHIVPIYASQSSPVYPSTIQWPAQGESAVGISGTTILATHNVQKPVPTASTAKLITALCVLSQRPIMAGQQGPTITLGPSDVDIYNSYVAENGSVVPVIAGEQITEYQMLEAMMLPSANNMADSLAIWTFGSLQAYTRYANSYVARLGLTATHVGSDASGFLPDSVSTAGDLVKLGEQAIQNPVLAQIVNQKSVSGIPVIGTIRNVNPLLGIDNVIGVKTGNNNQDLGAYISASKITLDNKPVYIVTSLANTTSLYNALYGSLPMIRSAQHNFLDVQLAAAGDLLGTYTTPWGASSPAALQAPLSAYIWGGTSRPLASHLYPLSTPALAGQIVGTLGTKTPLLGTSAEGHVILSRSLPGPSWVWRLTHPMLLTKII